MAEHELKPTVTSATDGFETKHTVTDTDGIETAPTHEDTVHLATGHGETLKRDGAKTKQVFNVGATPPGLSSQAHNPFWVA
jgi:hypothetical protein